jgi:hypothetical protein
MNIFKKTLDIFKEDIPQSKSREEENQEIINIYKMMQSSGYNEPNYALAEKVFREYNDFNLKNIN